MNRRFLLQAPELTAEKERMQLRNRYLMLAVIFFLASSGMLLLQFGGGYMAAFEALQQFSQQLFSDSIWMWITRFGDERILLVLSLLFARRRPDIFWAIMVTAVIGGLFSRGIKINVDALRPPAILGKEFLHLVGPALKHHSFPSGHTLSIFIFCGVLFIFTKGWYKQLALLLVAALIAVSRVALGVHWPIDLLGGAATGLMAAVIGTWIVSAWKAGLRPRVHLGLLIVPLLAMISLVSGDDGNPHVPLLVGAVISFALLKALYDYRDLFVSARES